MPQPDAHRLADVVRKRRGELGLTQAEVQARGGPSDTTLTKVEQAVGTPSRQTLMKLDSGLDWAPGSARAVLDGGDPEPVARREAPAGFRRSDALAVRNAVVHGGSAHQPSPEQLWLAWAELSHELVVIEAAYAARRGLALDDARRELTETLVERQMRRRPEPWTAPWDRPATGSGRGPGVTYLREAGAAAYDGDPELSDPDDEVHPS